MAINGKINGTKVPGLVNGAEAAEHRVHRRKSVMWAARLETEHGACECSAFDVSAGGAKLRLHGPVTLNSPVRLVLERYGPIPAVAIWRRGATLGLRFTAPEAWIRELLGSALPI